MMRRGDIFLVDLDPAQGSEAAKRRPAVVVSNDGANTVAARLGRGVVTVVPVTSSVARVYPFQVLLPAADCGLPRDSKAQAEQVRSVAVARLGQRVGRVPAPLMTRVDEALRLHLAL
ncbi:MAG: type II toxin-antitoxin system PemK/MazF family toxin [Acidimicrobiia bacterium]|nr:type II toxin-antitoxin system PemK/MazF family toxin [Acidimicrobiia bacterium]